MIGASRQRLRIAVTIGFGVVAAAVAWRAQFMVGSNGGDHILLWQGARTLISGGDPYAPPAAATLQLYYPIPALFLALPFVLLSPAVAAFCFIVLSAAILGYAVTRDGFARVPLLFSVPFLVGVQFAQATPLVLAFGLVPALAGLTVCKPNLGLALLVWRRPHNLGVIIAAIVVLVSLAVRPPWPVEWLATVRRSPGHHAPWNVGIGAVTLLAVLRWRRPEARLLTVMTLVPHGLFFYDELPLFLVANTRREAMLLSLTSWLGWIGWIWTSEGPSKTDMEQWVILSLYIPALLLVLRRRNEGQAPVWLERRLSRLPRWVRGTETVSVVGDSPH